MELSKRWEIAANAAVVCLCVMMMGVTAWKVVLPRASADTRNKPPVGKVLIIAGVDWNGTEKTIVLGLSTQCHFCTESAPFFRKLAELGKAKHVRIIAVFPQIPTESARYFQDLGVPIEEVRQSPLNSIYVRATPTLLIVNRAGVVTDGWVGKLPEALETEVLGKL